MPDSTFLMRRAVRVCARPALLATALLGITFGTAAPASAHSLDEVVRASAGCGWSSGGYSNLEDRAVVTSVGTRYGTVYLLWSGTYQENCVVTLKSSYHGTESYTSASLTIQGDPEAKRDAGFYAHYAAVSWPAGGRCVKYQGVIQRPDTAFTASGSRLDWGFCD